jgi:hypothetical protein
MAGMMINNMRYNSWQARIGSTDRQAPDSIQMRRPIKEDLSRKLSGRR